MNYQANKLKAQTKTTKPTLTDQASAKDTDINRIVKSFLTSGTAPGAPKEAKYDDFTKYPEDLRGFIEGARALTAHQKQLPPELRELSLNELLNLPTSALLAKLVKPATKQDDKQEEKK